MAGKNVSIKIKADAKDFEKGIDKATSAINKLGKSKLVSSIGKVGTAFTGLKNITSTATQAIKAAAAAVNDTIEAYNRQASAETALEGAARNNPYLNEANVQRLKDYASELQSISTFGDEELLPMMAQLAAAGRTQAEIQDIMSASVDIAASGTMSLESAVKNLNKTYSGLSGELGEANPAIKSLTKEQLRNGEAVNVMRQQYGGIAKSVADATGGWKQFQNSLGDLKETIGQNFAEARNSAGKVLSNFFQNIISKMKLAGQEAENFASKLGIITADTGGEKSKEQIEGTISELESNIKRLSNVKKYATMTDLDIMQEQASLNSKISEKEKTLIKKNKDAEWRNLEMQIQAAKSARNMSVIGTDEYNEASTRINELMKAQRQREKAIEQENHSAQVEIDIMKSTAENLKGTAADARKVLAESYNGDVADLNKDIARYEEALAKQKSELAGARSKAEIDAGNESAEKLEEETSKILAQKAAYEQKVALLRKEAEIKGKEVSDQDLLNAKIDHYLAVWQESGDWAKTYLENLKKEIDEGIREIYGDIEIPELDLDASAPVAEQMKQLESYREILVSMQADVDKDSEAFRSLAEAIARTDEMMKTLSATARNWGDLDTWGKLSFAEEQFAGLSSSISEALSLASETMDNEASAALSRLESQYAQGLVSEDDYYTKKEKIEQDSARKKYKVELATWALNLAATQSASALAIANTLKEGGTLGMIQAAVMGVQTAVQLASQIAAKPVPPSFASGGVVGGFQGASTGGDNTYVHARSGEMMLNAAQQRNLYDIAKTGGGGVKWSIVVNNEAGDVADASAQVSEGSIRIAVKRIISEAMAGGELNDSYQAMRAGIYGRRITS